MIKVALVGNPNSGKTTLFNALTGSTAHVGNWPGVTVDKKEGIYKKGTELINVMDLPGIYSLSPYTPEEVVARKYIIDEKPDCIINIVDATNLERNLYLTTQVMEINVPIVIALNMVDALERSGASIDAAQLQEKIGLPVVSISALKGRGLQELMAAVSQVVNIPREGETVLEHSDLVHLIGDINIALKVKEVDNSLFHAIKLVELDELEIKEHSDLVGIVDAYKGTINDEVFGGDFEGVVADSRYKYITANYSPVYKQCKDVGNRRGCGCTKGRKNAENSLVEQLPLERSQAGYTISDKVDRVLTNKWAGIPIFLLILFSIFHITFSENILFLGGIPAIGGFVSNSGSAFEGVFINGGVMSIGVVLQGLMGVLVDSIGGWITMGLEAVSSPEWVIGLLVDGVWGGIGGVLSFVPQILLLFLLFSILEDTGYMARVAFILDRIFRRFGLSGRAFMPMIMGFGCSIPAMINTRTLSDDKERLATLRVIPFFSCGAKLPILTAIAGAIATVFGLPGTDFITYGMYLVGMVTAFVAIVLMRNTTQKGENAPFIMELPSYRAPRALSLILLLWDKLKHYIQKAFTVILASSIIIWLMTHFSWSWTYLPDDKIGESILAGVGMFIQPIFTPLGFGSQLGANGWVFAVAAITGLIAKENVVATFAVLAAVVSSGFGGATSDGIQEVAAMIGATGIGVAGLIAFIVFNMTTIPCFAAVATAKAEIGDKKKFNYTLLFWMATSYIVATMFYLVGEFIWPVAIFIAIAMLVTTGIVINNKSPELIPNILKSLKIRRK